MKYLKRVFILNIVIISILFVSGCSFNNISTLNTELIIDENFSGKRVMTLSIDEALLSSKSIDVFKISDFIFSNAPKDLSFERARNSNKIDFIFTLSFNSLDDYRSKVKNIIGNDADTSYFYSKENLFTNGVKVYENFTSKDFFKFFEDNLNNDFKNFTDIKCSGTKVVFKGIAHWTSGKINLSNISYTPIDKIVICTKCNENNKYNRSFSIVVKKDVTENIENDLYDYFSKLESDKTLFKGCKISDNFLEYSISFDKLDINSLNEVTSQFIGCISGSSHINYDIDDSMTTFYNKCNCFAETLDLSQFSSGLGNVKLEYFFECSKPINKIELYKDSDWKEYDKNLVNNFYCIKSEDNIFKVRIFDDEKYNVDSLSFKLKHIDGDNFEKSVSFNYGKNNIESFDYIKDFFKRKGLENTTFFNNGDLNTCEIKKSGTVNDLSNYYSKVFGDKNVLTYDVNKYGISFFDDVNVKDKVVLSNKKEKVCIPINYNIIKNKSDIIKSLDYNFNYKKNKIFISDDKSDEVKFDLNEDNFVVKYKYSQKNIFKILSGFFIVFIIFIIVIFIIYIINRKTEHILEEHNGESN